MEFVEPVPDADDDVPVGVPEVGGHPFLSDVQVRLAWLRLDTLLCGSRCFWRRRVRLAVEQSAQSG